MSSRYVKNTIFNYLGNLVAPHYCTCCGKIGSLICVDCKYNIVCEIDPICIACRQPTTRNSLCSKCQKYYSQAWTLGSKAEDLERIIYRYKFERIRGLGAEIADLLSQRIGILPQNVIVVPVPTIRSHIRQRGYDHALLIAQEVARRNNVEYQSVLGRRTSNKQRGASRAKRIAQAKQAFCLVEPVDQSKIYLIIDDVTTTGATLDYAAKTLVDAGASSVWVAVAMYQPID